MSSLSKARVAVVGGGALGMATAAVLAAHGASPLVIDPAQGANASAVAAGMISPGFEAALDGVTEDRAALYREAAMLWPAFDATYRLGLVRDGADWRGEPEPLATDLERLGFAFRRERGVIHLPDEARLDARRALQRLNDVLADSGGRMVRERATAVEVERDRPVLRVGDRSIAVDILVLAAGWSVGALLAPGLEGLLSFVTPVRGQLQVLEGTGVDAISRITRTRGLYLTPVGDRLVVGATMEPGRSDLQPDPAATECLLRAAFELEPALADATIAATAVGIRGASPDGLPIAGATPVPGVFAALAPNRGGWLYAPMIGEAVAAAIAGKSPRRHPEAFRPDRFGPA